MKGLVSQIAHGRIRQGARVALKQLKGRAGMLPSFLIIGGQKCGTTSLYEYLTRHPFVCPAAAKEIGFFNRVEHYSKGIGWYRDHFPLDFNCLLTAFMHGRHPLTGEADASYVINPHALRRIAATLPHVKLILLLRNPIDRAFSHYQHTRRMGKESLSFEEALRKEPERVAGAWERMLHDEHFFSLDIEYYSYTRRGIYADQVSVLLSLFPRTQALILEAEEFSADPGPVYRRVLQFLGMSDWQLKHYERHNSGRYSAMNPITRRWLLDYFRPHNQRLYEYVGNSFDWDR